MFMDDMITDIINGLCQIFKSDILQIILYGSVAREEASDESDIDIAIILNNNVAQHREEFISWNSEMDMKYDRVFSIIDIENEMMEKWGNVLPFYKNIKKEGIILWKAA